MRPYTWPLCLATDWPAGSASGGGHRGEGTTLSERFVTRARCQRGGRCLASERKGAYCLCSARRTVIPCGCDWKDDGSCHGIVQGDGSRHIPALAPPAVRNKLLFLFP